MIMVRITLWKTDEAFLHDYTKDEVEGSITEFLSTRKRFLRPKTIYRDIVCTVFLDIYGQPHIVSIFTPPPTAAATYALYKSGWERPTRSELATSILERDPVGALESELA